MIRIRSHAAPCPLQRSFSYDEGESTAVPQKETDSSKPPVFKAGKTPARAREDLPEPLASTTRTKAHPNIAL